MKTPDQETLELLERAAEYRKERESVQLDANQRLAKLGERLARKRNERRKAHMMEIAERLGLDLEAEQEEHDKANQMMAAALDEEKARITKNLEARQADLERLDAEIEELHFKAPMPRFDSAYAHGSEKPR